MDKPYLVQAYVVNNRVGWVTDSRHATAYDAIAAAHVLCTDWGRKVRVIDQEEHVHFKANPSPALTRDTR